MDGFVAVAKATRLFGKDGELMLALYDTFPDKIDMEEPVWIIMDSLPVPLFFESFERRGQSGAIALFSDIDTPARAQVLLGSEINVSSEKASDKRSRTDVDSPVGFRAIVEIEDHTADRKATTGGESMEGTVINYYDDLNNPLLEIDLGGRTILVPATEPFILNVDPDKRTLHISIDRTLAELNM